MTSSGFLGLLLKANNDWQEENGNKRFPEAAAALYGREATNGVNTRLSARLTTEAKFLISII